MAIRISMTPSELDIFNPQNGILSVRGTEIRAAKRRYCMPRLELSIPVVRKAE